MSIRTARFTASIALGAIGLAAASGFEHGSALWKAVTLLAWAWLVFAAVDLGTLIWKWVRRDRYDLRALYEIDRRERLNLIDDEPVIHGDNVLCPYCHNVYSSKLPSCPSCKKTLGT